MELALAFKPQGGHYWESIWDWAQSKDMTGEGTEDFMGRLSSRMT